MTEPNPVGVSQIAELYRDAGWWDDAPEHLEKIAKIIAGSHCFVTAMAEGEIVGMGRAISDGVSDAYVQDITVKMNRRGQGIARHIVRALVKRLNADGLHWIALIAERGTHALYSDLGFAEMPNSTPLLLQDD
ncbi:MAG: GNAT family N-acetyltransferase [Deltaproteobacteria bacterium]|nr:GNAT family N-acetyltransferase [Deltaproteobacteria bacterium]